MLWPPALPIILFVISLSSFAGGGAMVNHTVNIIPLVAETGRIFGSVDSPLQLSARVLGVKHRARVLGVKCRSNAAMLPVTMLN